MKTLTEKSLLSSLCQPTVGALSKGGIIPLFGKEACLPVGRGEGRFLKCVGLPMNVLACGIVTYNAVSQSFMNDSIILYISGYIIFPSQD
jgi:hypothetical protein